jgi:hypothetical protein
MIRSCDFHAPPNAAPTRDDMHQAFLWLDQLAAENQRQMKGRQVGTRLYLYTSGHGFSPRARQGCLLAGDAAERQFSANVYPSGWIDWLQDADYFREYVLWMDCCMDRVVVTPPTLPPLDPLGVGAAPGPTFIAFAAPRPLKAVEKSIPEDAGRWHGIFTWNLLQGLRGAAINEFGNITGRSLADWLRQTQLGWLDKVDCSNPELAKEPAIIAEDDALIFARGVGPMALRVTLRLPAAMAGQQVRLWTGTPARAGAPFAIPVEGATVDLLPGLYVAEVRANGLRHGFVVTRPCDVELTDAGDSPVECAHADHYRLTVEPGDATANIRVVDEGFGLVETSSGSMYKELPAGMYQIRIRIGRQISEKVILLDGDWPKPPVQPAMLDAPPVGLTPTAEMLPALPMITSAAPLPATRATHEYQQWAARSAIDRIDVTAGSGAELMVMARAYTGDVPQAAIMPWDSVAVLRADGSVVADLTTDGQRDTRGDPVGVCTFSLSPGAYLLRYPSDGSGLVEQSLVLPDGWRLEVYLLSRATDTGQRTRPALSLLMRRPHNSWGTPEDLLLEKTRVALADERSILNNELDAVLLRKFDNPMAGIIGGHLLLISHEQGVREDLTVLNEVVGNLRGLVGQEHPDVEALSLACPSAGLRRTRPITAAPLFERSWRMIAAGSRDNPDLVPLRLWQAVHATASAPPFLAWSADAGVQQAFREALALALFGRHLGPADPLGAARDLMAATPAIVADIVVEAPSRIGGGAGVGSMADAIRHRAEELDLPPIALNALLTEFRPADILRGGAGVIFPGRAEPSGHAEVSG